METTNQTTADLQRAAKPYQPTPSEHRVIEAAARAKPLLPRVKVKQEGKTAAIALTVEHSDQAIGQILLMQSLGTSSAEFFDGLIGQLSNAVSTGKTISEDGLNFMLSIVQGVEPRDQVEAMLASQMAATHNATMTFARRLAHVETIQQQDSAERAYNKLARTFAAQVEALKRYRSSGDQTVRVEHVTVNEGGQAIVGNVMPQGWGGSEKTRTTP